MDLRLNLTSFACAIETSNVGVNQQLQSLITFAGNCTSAYKVFRGENKSQV